MDEERRPLVNGHEGSAGHHDQIVDSAYDTKYSKYGQLGAGTGSIQQGIPDDTYGSVGYHVGQSTKDSNPEVKPEVYARRFYILGVFSLLTLVQSMVWNTWGPISQSAKHVFDWTDADIALLANWGPISFLVCLVFFSWMLEVKGLRWSCLSTSFLVAAGTALRCITFQLPWATWLIHAGQFLNGLGGPVAMAACTVISSRWFPSHQRTTSTSIGNLANSVGAAIAFVIGPIMVPQHDISCNSTVIWNASHINGTSAPIDLWQLHDPMVLDDSVSDCPNASVIAEYIEEERDGIKKLMYSECAVTGAILPDHSVVLSVYASPPSQSDRLHWQSRLQNRTEVSTVDQAGWMGFYSIMAGTLGGLTIARFADVFSKHMKVYLLVLYLASSGILLWMALMVGRIVPSSVEYLYIAVIGGNVCIGSGVPLLYELSCEVTYPIPEAVTTGGLALYNNVGGLIFLFLVMIPGKDTSWTNWCLVGSVVFCIPVLLMLKENYKRLDIDIEVAPPNKTHTSDANATAPHDARLDSLLL